MTVVDQSMNPVPTRWSRSGSLVVTVVIEATLAVAIKCLASRRCNDWRQLGSIEHDGSVLRLCQSLMCQVNYRIDMNLQKVTEFTD